MTRLNKIEEYIAGNPKRPLLVWFYSNDEINEVRRSIMNIPGCVWCDKYIYEKDGVIILYRECVKSLNSPLCLTFDTPFFFI